MPLGPNQELTQAVKSHAMAKCLIKCLPTTDVNNVAWKYSPPLPLDSCDWKQNYATSMYKEKTKKKLSIDDQRNKFPPKLFFGKFLPLTLKLPINWVQLLWWFKLKL